MTVGLDLRRARSLGRGPARRQRIALGVAAVGRVDRAEAVEAAVETARCGIWSVECQELV